MIVLLELPGVAPEHIAVTLGSHSLHVVVDTPEPLEGCSLPSGRHEVGVELPTGVSPDELDASLSKGVLRIRIPKAATGLRRLIPIAHGTDD